MKCRKGGGNNSRPTWLSLMKQDGLEWHGIIGDVVPRVNLPVHNIRFTIPGVKSIPEDEPLTVFLVDPLPVHSFLSASVGNILDAL